MPSNDNDRSIRGPIPPPTGAHGHAALLLVESLIHALCENSTLRADQAVDLVERAVSVQFDQAEAADGAGAPMWRSHALLIDIAASLRVDSNGGPLPPRLVS